MRSVLFIGVNMFLQYRRPKTSLIIKGIVLSIFIIAPICLYAPSQSTSDFQSLDGDREEMAAGQSNKFFLRKEYSLTTPYQGAWNLAGSAVVTGDFVRLTPDSQSRRGAVLSRLPVHIRHWEVRVNFRVHGSPGQYYGDGLAFWYVDPSVAAEFPGPAFGGREKFRGLAVFLDTYSNYHGPQGYFHPYVSAVVSNGSVAFAHEADGEQREPVGCTARFRNRDHETLISIRYVDGILTVSTDVDNRSGWQRCFRVRGVRLPTHYVFGLSAMTGDLSDNHDIVYMKVYEVESTLNPDDYSENSKLIEPSIDGLSVAAEKSGGTTAGDSSFPGSVGLLAVGLALLGFAALAGLALLHRWDRQRRVKRFY